MTDRRMGHSTLYVYMDVSRERESFRFAELLRSALHSKALSHECYGIGAM